MRRLLPVLLGLLVAAAPAALARGEGDELLGTPAPEFHTLEWLDSEPLTLAGLYGSVVLVRFWTGDCPLCSASLPILAELHAQYARDGLVVIGIYHPKPPGARGAAAIAEAVSTFGITFPIGLDPDWETLQRFWLGDAERTWTSPTFLIDRRGTIRHIHPGGSYTPEDAERLEDTIVRLLVRRG